MCRLGCSGSFMSWRIASKILRISWSCFSILSSSWANLAASSLCAASMARSFTKIRMIATLTWAARLLLRTEESMRIPCSVKGPRFAVPTARRADRTPNRPFGAVRRSARPALGQTAVPLDQAPRPPSRPYAEPTVRRRQTKRPTGARPNGGAGRLSGRPPLGQPAALIQAALGHLHLHLAVLPDASAGTAPKTPGQLGQAGPIGRVGQARAFYAVNARGLLRVPPQLDIPKRNIKFLNSSFVS